MYQCFSKIFCWDSKEKITFLYLHCSDDAVCTKSWHCIVHEDWKEMFHRKRDEDRLPPADNVLHSLPLLVTHRAPESTFLISNVFCLGRDRDQIQSSKLQWHVLFFTQRLRTRGQRRLRAAPPDALAVGFWGVGNDNWLNVYESWDQAVLACR